MAKVENLQTFTWEGVDKKGRKTKGEASGTNINTVKAELRRQGVNPTKVRKKPKPLFEAKKKITPQDIALFTRQLATMMESGVPLIQSFELIADGVDNPSMKQLLTDVKNDVASGTNLAQALKKHPIYFDDLFCNLVEAGESSGSLETMLDRVATYKEKTEALKAKIKKAMTYPIAVIVVAVIVSAILLIKVVPQFEDMFSNFGAELPAFTQVVIGMSEWMQEFWFIALGILVAGFFTFREVYRRSEGFRHAMDRIQLQVPIVGEIMHKSAVARFARTLATTFAAGVPLVDALESVAGATGNIVYSSAVRQIKEDVSTGTQLAFCMKQAEIFPSMAVQMTAIGEEAGSLDSMLDKVATFYEDEVDNMVDNLTALMEPMIMAVLGVLVGGLIIAMYLPIFQLGQVV